jgi:hypothetical protein
VSGRPLIAIPAVAWLLLSAPPALAAEGVKWAVAAPGPCAESEARPSCPAGECENAPARARFSPVDVAATGVGPEGIAPPTPLEFPGPGSCADPGTPCGKAGVTPSPAPSVVEQPPGGPAPPP